MWLAFEEFISMTTFLVYLPTFLSIVLWMFWVLYVDSYFLKESEFAPIEELPIWKLLLCKYMRKYMCNWKSGIQLRLCVLDGTFPPICPLKYTQPHSLHFRVCSMIHSLLNMRLPVDLCCTVHLIGNLWCRNSFCVDLQNTHVRLVKSYLVQDMTSEG